MLIPRLRSLLIAVLGGAALTGAVLLAFAARPGAAQAASAPASALQPVVSWLEGGARLVRP